MSFPPDKHLSISVLGGISAQSRWIHPAEGFEMRASISRKIVRLWKATHWECALC
jgi:hypothetical protein